MSDDQPWPDAWPDPEEHADVLVDNVIEQNEEDGSGLVRDSLRELQVYLDDARHQLSDLHVTADYLLDAPSMFPDPVVGRLKLVHKHSGELSAWASRVHHEVDVRVSVYLETEDAEGDDA